MDYLKQRPQRDPAIVWRHEKRKEERVLQALEAGDEVDDQGTVLLVVAGTMHQLNLIGGMIWSLCDGERSGAAIAEALAGEFCVERSELDDDVREFLQDLTGRGWLSYD